MSKNPFRMSLDAVKETCPAVDEAFDYLVDEIERFTGRNAEINDAIKICKERIKEQTGLLREALVGACEEQLNIVAEKNEELKALESDYETQLRNAEREVADLQYYLDHQD